MDINLGAINTRLHALQTVKVAKPYQRQKSKLQQELEAFLASLTIPKSLLSASPHDLIRFLIWKDQQGKTAVHTPQCPSFGSNRRRALCACPTRLAAGTVESYIGKLRAIFISAGLREQSCDSLTLGNPAAHPALKQYLTSMREEQAKARVTPKQAVPFFFDKFSTLCSHLRKLTLSQDLSPASRYLYSRDLAFFCLDFYSGDRASDLGRVYTKEILTLPDGDGFLFHHLFGKTLRGGSSNIFAVKACEDRSICPVANLRLYVTIADRMGIPLRDGYLFRVMDPKGKVSSNPFQGSAVASRLRHHLEVLRINDGETMHSFRAGCSITLSLLGASTEEVARHVGWRSLSTAKYYSQKEKVMDTAKLASLLRDSGATTATEPISQAARLGQQFRVHNQMRDFRLAFPS